MGHFSCVIQENGPARAAEAVLEERLVELHAQHYPDEPTSVSWRRVPDGYMFTEGRPSTSSIIACVIEHDTTREQREHYMTSVCDNWTDITGCTDHEVVVAITRANPDQ